MEIRIKTIIRRILFFPFFIIVLPFLWFFSKGTMRDFWEEAFLDYTDENTDYEGGMM